MNFSEAISHLDRVIPDHGNPDTGEAFEVLRKAEASVEELEAENRRLRKVAAHVPAKAYIAAKAAAGFSEPIIPQA